MSSPSWHPDPFHRHELRWWDGASWSDNVMDGGIAGTDPTQAQAPVAGQWDTPTQMHPMVPPPGVAQPMPGTMPTMPVPVQQAPVGAPQKRTGLLVGGVAAVAALGIGAFVLLGGDDDSKQANTTSTIAVSTTVPAVSTTVAATTTTAVTTTTTPPTTLPPGADADTLIAAMPTAADTPADWSRYSEPELDGEPDSVVGVGYCGGDNAIARALAANSIAQASGPTWDLPAGGWFGMNAYSFESAEDASAYLEATELQASSCMTEPIVDTWPEVEVDLFADGYGDDAVWSVAEGNFGFAEDTADADRLLRIVFDQYLALNYEGVDYSVTFSELSRSEQHGRVVLVFWLYGAWDYLGWDSAPDWAYTPVDADLDAATSAIRATLLANLDAAGAL